MGGGALLTMLLFASDGSSAPEPNDAQLLERAETAFEKGCQARARDESGQKEFQSAAASYEELRRRGAVNPALYRNLGNAYVLADDLPHAILAYRRGLRLAPNDEGLLAGLTAARKRVVYLEDDPLGQQIADPRPPLLPLYADKVLLFAAFVLYAGVCVALTRWFMTRQNWLLIAAALALLAAALPTTLSAWLFVDREQRQKAEQEHTLGVIKDDGVLVRKGDGEKYPKRYDAPLNRGVEARLLHERPGWVQIELAGGEVGWVPRAYVLIDRPDAD